MRIALREGAETDSLEHPQRSRSLAARQASTAAEAAEVTDEDGDAVFTDAVTITQEFLEQLVIRAPQSVDSGAAGAVNATAADMDAAIRTIAGSARSIGITVEGL